MFRGINYRSILRLSNGSNQERQVNSDEEQTRELMAVLCSSAIDYELVETEDAKDFFFVIPDSYVPNGNGTGDSIVRSAQGRAGYHSFIGIHELSSRKNEPRTFGFLVCPLSIKKNLTLSRILQHLIAKSNHGKNDVFVKIIGRSSYSRALANGVSVRELFDNTFQVAGNEWTGISLTMDIVSATYNAVCELKWVPEYSSSLCPYCCNDRLGGN